jgi:KipI family sensor histidine kinase inhibitor
MGSTKNSNSSNAKIEFVSDAALLITFESPSLIESNRKVLSLFEKLQREIKTWPITNLHPAYGSLLIDFDPAQCEPRKLERNLQTVLASQFLEEQKTGELITIPVIYGGDEGPDLEEVAHIAGLSPQQVIELHSSVEYTVAFVGFAPGFPYLLGLPEKLESPRKKAPRLTVPAGSVAVAGLQTGIYPTVSPGGWQLIGQAKVVLFDPRKNQPTFLKPGDRVLFVPAQKESRSGSINSTSGSKQTVSENILKIESSGFYSTVQDHGRDGWTHLGVSPGGAADPLALKIGQQLVGNSSKAAAIEMTSHGGVFTFLKDTWFAVTGADCSPELDQQKIKMWTAVPVSAGQRLVTGRIEKNLRSYLHLHGGLGVESLLQGRSTVTSGGWGGWQGRTLVAQDVLPAGNQIQSSPTFRRCDEKIKFLYHENDVQLLRVTRGPQRQWFAKEAVNDFFAQEFEVSNEVNRLGLRLVGPAMSYHKDFKDKELISEGVADGAIQVPAGGQPMILFCEQRTTGGYAKIANVIQADRFRLGQLRPGQKIRFQEVDLEEAWRLNHELEVLLKTSVSEF